VLSALSLLILVFLVVGFWHILFAIFRWLVSKLKPSKSENQQESHGPVVGFGIKLLKDLLVGLTMMAVTIPLHHHPLLENPEDASMDFVIKNNHCKENESCEFYDKIKALNIPPMVLVDVDDKTFKQWQDEGEELLVTPRKKIAILIEKAVRDEAKAIVVDIFLTQKIPMEKNQWHQGDKILYNYLMNDYPSYCRSSKNCPPIIMIRDVIPTNESQQDIGFGEQQPFYKPQESFLDEAIEKSSPHVSWASPLFVVSEFDYVLRRWWLWHHICDEKNSKPRVSLSIQLSIIGAMGDKNFSEITSHLPQVKEDCSNENYRYTPLPLSKEQLKFFENELGIKQIEGGEVTGGGISPRIMFTLPWPKKENKSNVLTVLSASTYEKAQTSSDLKGSIVIIGSSRSDTRDIHKTPIGEMPGMLVIANAIYSLLLNQGELKNFSTSWVMVLWKVIMILLFFVAGTAIASSLPRFFYWPLMFLTTALIWFFLELRSAELLKQGVWIDFSLPLVAILFHQIADDCHGSKEKSKKSREGQPELGNPNGDKKVSQDIPPVDLNKEVEKQEKQENNQKVDTVKNGNEQQGLEKAGIEIEVKGGEQKTNKTNG